MKSSLTRLGNGIKMNKSGWANNVQNGIQEKVARNKSQTKNSMQHIGIKRIQSEPKLNNESQNLKHKW